MEPVVCYDGFGETSACRAHHGRREVGGDLLDFLSFILRNLFKYGNEGIRQGSPYDGNQRAFLAMRITVCDYGIDLPATQACLVYGKIWSQVPGVEDILLGMFKLVPIPVITELLPILPGEQRALYSVMGTDAAYALGLSLNLLLLKKLRTPVSACCLPRLARSCR